MNPRIDQRIAPLVVEPQKLLTAETKEVVTDATLGGAWVNMNPRQVIQTVVDGSTPGKIGHSVSVEHTPSPVTIEVFGTYPPCGLNRSLQVANKPQPTPPALVWNTQKLDAVVDPKFPADLDYASIFSKVIGHKLSNSSSDDLYLRCMMNVAADFFQIQAPQFMNLRLLTINKLEKISVLGTPDTRI